MALPKDQLDVTNAASNQDWITTWRTLTDGRIVRCLTKVGGLTSHRTRTGPVRSPNGDTNVCTDEFVSTVAKLTRLAEDAYDNGGASSGLGISKRRDSVIHPWSSSTGRKVITALGVKKIEKHAPMTAKQQGAEKARLAALLQQFGGSTVPTADALTEAGSKKVSKPRGVGARLLSGESTGVSGSAALSDKQVLRLAYYGSVDEDVQARAKALKDTKAEARAAQLAEKQAARLAAKEQNAEEARVKRCAAKAAKKAAALNSSLKSIKEGRGTEKQREAAERHYAFKKQAGTLNPELEKVVKVLRNLRSKKDLKVVMDFASDQLDQQEGVDHIIEEMLQIEQNWEEDNHEYVLMLTRFLERQGIVPMGALEM